MVDEVQKIEESLRKVPQSNEEILGKLEKASERLELATKRFEKAKLEDAERKAEKLLQGQGDAGVPTEKKEELPAEYAARVMAGDV